MNQVDKEHIQYEFDVLLFCVKNIVLAKDVNSYCLLNSSGFLAAWNLWNYCKDMKLLKKMYVPSDCKNLKYLEEIVSTIKDQIVTLTSNRTSELEYKLSPQDMQDMFKFFYHNAKMLEINIKNTEYQQWADRYMVYGDRKRKRKS